MRQFVISLKGFTVLCVYCDDIIINSNRVYFMKNEDLVTSITRSGILSIDECIDDNFVEINF